MELKNIERGEPDSALFEIPRDYMVVEKTASAMLPSSTASPVPAMEPGATTPRRIYDGRLRKISSDLLNSAGVGLVA